MYDHGTSVTQWFQSTPTRYVFLWNKRAKIPLYHSPEQWLICTAQTMEFIVLFYNFSVVMGTQWGQYGPVSLTWACLHRCIFLGELLLSTIFLLYSMAINLCIFWFCVSSIHLSKQLFTFQHRFYPSSGRQIGVPLTFLKFWGKPEII